MNTLLRKHIQKASHQLRSKLLGLRVSSLPISTYNQRYLSEKIRNIDAILDIYCHILYLALKDYHSALADFVLVDYGGGSGVFSLLAKETGIGTVIYNDIYDVSCADMATTAKYINMPADHIVCGDADNLTRYLQQHSISIHAIASFDVIEHIYNIEAHFKKLTELQVNPFKLVYGSGANIENPLKVCSITKIHLADEYENKEKTWGRKERDTLQSFLEIRKDVIKSYAPQIAESDVEYLAKNTRGLSKKDIEKYTEAFIAYGKISYQIKHRTNTCDPLTGNWSEHLIDLNWLKKYVNHLGFSAEIVSGYYTPNGPLYKKYIQYIVNYLIRLLKRKGMFMAPYYVLVARKQS